jgi:hypothetical protein
MSYTPPGPTDLPVAGTATVTDTAAAISASTVALSSILLQASKNNTADVTVGNATAQPIVLEPGDSIVLAVSRASSVYASTESTDDQAIGFLGSAV